MLFLHGGPGSSCNADHRRYFDPGFFDIVLFDQRGCGRSTPLGEVAENDTWQLVEDIDAIRTSLELGDRVCLFGGSWGSTLSLAYATRYPRAIEEMILRGVFLGTGEEVRWFTDGLARFAPGAWQEFADGTVDDLVEYYYREVNSPDRAIASRAARRWASYEARTMRIGASDTVQNRDIPLPAGDPLLARVRVQLHYLKNRCFLDDNQLLESATDITMPVTIVQGGLDFICPPITAFRLGKLLPRGTLRLVNDAGHDGMSGKLAAALTEEANRLRDRLRNRHESAI